MASVKTIKRKTKTAFQIVYYQGLERKYLSLGSCYKKQDALQIAAVIQDIVDADKIGVDVSAKTKAFLQSLNPDLQKRLERANLIHVERKISLKDLYNAYIQDDLERVKSSTRDSRIDTYNRASKFLNFDVIAEEITLSEIQEFCAWLGSNYSQSTKATTLAHLRRVYNYGISNDLVKTNPFNRIKKGSDRNKDREFYIDENTFNIMLSACKDDNERALITLYRIGGLRRAEALLITPKDVDFANKRLRVHSPKTARHGKTTRVIPLYPRLYDALQKLDYRNENAPLLQYSYSSIYSTVKAILTRAKLRVYPRIIQNLRSSCAIDTFNRFGEIAERDWLGHTTRTAFASYLHTTAEQFAVAIADGPQNGPQTAVNGR